MKGKGAATSSEWPDYEKYHHFGIGVVVILGMGLFLFIRRQKKDLDGFAESMDFDDEELEDDDEDDDDKEGMPYEYTRFDHDVAVRNLWKRKLRTFLTILGVVIGTTSIVVMISIGIGMNESFEKQVEEWGSLQVIDVYSNNGDMYISSDTNANRGKPQKKAVLDAQPSISLSRWNMWKPYHLLCEKV